MYAALFKSTSSNINIIKNKQIMEPFGWLNTVYDLAERKIFDHSNLNSIQSVLKSNCWEVMSYLQWSDKKNKFKEEVSKSQKEEQKQKQKNTRKSYKNRKRR